MANAAPRGGSEGEQLGSYRLVRKLGRGGMGEVWLAEHDTIKSQVAIKLVLAAPDDEDAASRFLREAKATARIRHPGVVTVSDFGPRPAGGAYLVMELLDGESLADRIERGALSSDLAIDLGVQIAEALAAAHASGVIHRDLKPANIFLVRDAATRADVRVKLVDFGVAKATGKVTDELGMTVTGALVGTPVYMAPEQCSSRRGPIDERADLYALGVVLYEIVTGTPPFRGPTLGDLIDQHLNETPMTPRTVAPSIPAKLDVLIMTLLAKDRADRPASANEVARVLHELRGTTPSPIALDETLASGAKPKPRDGSIDATIDSSAKPGVLTQATGTATPQPAGERIAAPALSAAQTSTPPRTRRIAIVAAGIALAAITVGVVLIAGRSKPKTDYSTSSRSSIDKDCEANQIGACNEIVKREISQTLPPPNFSALSTALVRACSARDSTACARLAGLAITGRGAPADYARAKELATASCDANDGRGCEVLGQILADGIGIEIDPVGALARRERACELGRAEACHDASRTNRFGVGVPINIANADRLMARAIELGDAGCKTNEIEACYTRALIYALGDGKKSDPVLAAPIFERACNAGHAGACGDLGNLLIGGNGVAPDPTRALALFERGCMAGHDLTCWGWLGLMARGAVGDADVPRAVEMATSACRDRGDRQCGMLADLYGSGIGFTRDPARASEMHKKACLAGLADNCMLATAWATIPPRTPEEILKLRTRGCDMGSYLSCSALGTSIVEKDPVLALVYFERACNVSDRTLGCEHVATSYLEGRGVPKDVERARKIFEDGCKNAGSFMCGMYGRRLRDGNGFAKDSNRAIELFETACSGLDPRSCHDGATMLREGKDIKADPKHADELDARACKLAIKYCPKPAEAGSGSGSAAGSASGSGSAVK